MRLTGGRREVGKNLKNIKKRRDCLSVSSFFYIFAKNYENMSETELIIALVWVLGIFFNLMVVNKFFPEDDNVDPLTALFLLPIMMVMELIKLLFIIGSWMTWIAVGIIMIEEWVKSSIEKKKTS